MDDASADSNKASDKESTTKDNEKPETDGAAGKRSVIASMLAGARAAMEKADAALVRAPSVDTAPEPGPWSGRTRDRRALFLKHAARLVGGHLGLPTLYQHGAAGGCGVSTL